VQIENAKYYHFLALWGAVGAVILLLRLAGPLASTEGLKVAKDLWLFSLPVGTASFAIIAAFSFFYTARALACRLLRLAK
jgi:hypothetical protein